MADIIERKLQQSHNWCDENGFKFSPTKTICVHFCQLRKQHLDPQLYLYGTQIPIINEAKFIGFMFDSKLSFILHITSLMSRCTKSLDFLKVVSNTTWRGMLYRVWFCKTVEYKTIEYCSQSRLTMFRSFRKHYQFRVCMWKQMSYHWT